MPTRIFGEISGYPEGSQFETRIELSMSGVHRPRQAGISGSAKEGADSIVLSGGYEDDEDFGDTIVYTGHGGRDSDTSQQVSDQLLIHQNLALALSCMHGLPLRVIRGHGHRSPYSPKFGYRYDGLYRVEEYWHEPGKAGYTVWRFRLAKLRSVTESARQLAEEPVEYKAAPTVETTILRIIRDTIQARKVKLLYEYRCQICNIRLEGSAGPYAEAAHIRPLSAPHYGSDTLDNLLCLCPNHHVLFDFGGIAVADDFTLLGLIGRLHVKLEHEIDLDNIRYHRYHYFKGI